MLRDHRPDIRSAATPEARTRYNPKRQLRSELQADGSLRENHLATAFDLRDDSQKPVRLTARFVGTKNSCLFRDCDSAVRMEAKTRRQTDLHSTSAVPTARVCLGLKARRRLALMTGDENTPLENG